MIDTIIPLGPNDLGMIGRTTSYAKRNIVGLRKLYVITHISNKQHIPPYCEFVDEGQFPFAYEDIAKWVKFEGRAGWYLQQLIKLYAYSVIHDLSDKFLVMDADLHIVKPTEFVNNGKALFSVSHEHHRPYFQHMKRIDPDFTRMKNCSGIVHHMVFDKQVLKDLMLRVETRHGQAFWKVFMKYVDKNEYCGASEYEMYFNYIQMTAPERMDIRFIKLRNVPVFSIEKDDILIAVHHYMRPK